MDVIGSATSLKKIAEDDFLSLLGHELRTPLAAINLWGGILRSGNLSVSEQQRAIDAIMGSVGSLDQSIDQLLDLLRLAAGKLVLQYESVDVETLAVAALERLQPNAAARGVQLDVAVHGELGRAYLDPTRLRQVLTSLLADAIEVTANGKRVTLQLSHDEALLTARVVNDGGREGAQRAGAAGALGLGLVITQQLVELQGGTLVAESPGPGQSSTFVVRLPWRAAGQGEPSAAATSEGKALEGVTVLLADDDEHTRLAMQSALENAGARVLSAESAKAALALVERADVPGVRMVLLSDLGLPRMSGYELVTELVSRRRNQQRPAMPACAVGAKTPDAAKRQAIEAGFDMFLAKPVTPERLVSAVLDLTELGLA